MIEGYSAVQMWPMGYRTWVRSSSEVFHTDCIEKSLPRHHAMGETGGMVYFLAGRWVDHLTDRPVKKRREVDPIHIDIASMTIFTHQSHFCIYSAAFNPLHLALYNFYSIFSGGRLEIHP